AVLMGGGLVLFGIGGDVSGGLFDAFRDNEGGGDGNSLVQKRVDKNEDRLKANPRSEAVRKALVRDYFQLATSQLTDGQTNYPDDAKDELRRAAANWKAYLALEPKKTDTSLARLMLQVYDPAALAKPKDALEVARIVAENEEEANAYLNLVQYAALAGDTRVADLAGQKAVDLSPKAERKTVKAQVKQLKQAQAQSQGQAQGGAAQP
ncbi:MAG: hypothetical protein ACREX8_02170, partial [Gammaproteobacteria bacterium]